MKLSYVYITTNFTRRVLYIGVTSNIVGRIWEHKEGVYENSFTSKYNVDILIYFEVFESIELAIEREKQLKRWKRVKKVSLINKMNPELKELYTKNFIEEYS